jgi:cell division protein FtsB
VARRQLNFNRRRNSGRALALWAVFFILALAIAPPVKHYFSQRAQISALNVQLSLDYKALDAARKELLQWQNPEYVKSQARERLHFVLPGERQYIVTQDENPTDSTSVAKVASTLADGQPWYSRLVASIRETG